jgi:hypothetical protein
MRRGETESARAMGYGVRHLGDRKEHEDEQETRPQVHGGAKSAGGKSTNTFPVSHRMSWQDRQDVQSGGKGAGERGRGARSRSSASAGAARGRQMQERVCGAVELQCSRFG